ncbi:MAG TPA: hypothetical protein VGM30_02155 [Puia sp.]|jgi:hypothetical protein
MKKVAICALIVLVIASCHKNSGPYPGRGPNSLWPLTAGNTWIYADSVFNDSVLTGNYPDTILENGRIEQDNTGSYYFGINNHNGWFGDGSFVSVDPNNYTIYEVDSPAYSPYIFFGAVSQDGQSIGTGTDYSNPACPLFSIQYGFATPEAVGKTYTNCLKNIQYVTDCHNVIQEAIATYMSPGIGLVRIADYRADSTHNNNLSLVFSQTLQSQTLH